MTWHIALKRVLSRLRKSKSLNLSLIKTRPKCPKKMLKTTSKIEAYAVQTSNLLANAFGSFNNFQIGAKTSSIMRLLQRELQILWTLYWSISLVLIAHRYKFKTLRVLVWNHLNYFRNYVLSILISRKYSTSVNLLQKILDPSSQSIFSRHLNDWKLERYLSILRN